MCKPTLFHHQRCGHTWAVISEPCGPGMGFSTCPAFGSTAVKRRPRRYETSSRTCPRCGLRRGMAGCGGDYDRNQVRMVEDMGNGAAR